MALIFHRLIKRDLRTVMSHYQEEVGLGLAARFRQEFEELALRVNHNPHRFHLVSEVLRRANFPSFPYHLLYRETAEGVKILVLRHHRRNPTFGTRRE